MGKYYVLRNYYCMQKLVTKTTRLNFLFQNKIIFLKYDPNKIPPWTKGVFTLENKSFCRHNICLRRYEKKGHRFFDFDSGWHCVQQRRLNCNLLYESLETENAEQTKTFKTNRNFKSKQPSKSKNSGHANARITLNIVIIIIRSEATVSFYRADWIRNDSAGFLDF